MPNKTLHRAAFALVALHLGWAGWSGSLLSVREARAQVLPGSTYSASGVMRSDIRHTRHNLSSTAYSRSSLTGSVTTEPVLQDFDVNGQTCVFCHTPHGGAGTVDRPLWNRTDSVATYTGYSSTSLQATVDMTVPSTPSKLCLSCHDGTIAIGKVNNAAGPGLEAATVALSGFGTTPPTPSGTMPYGRNQPDANHGFTRRLGTDLRNDHPVSFTFDSTLATLDGELRNPATSASPTRIANKGGTLKADFPLYGGRVHCPTCHEPHRNTQAFLRANRLVQSIASGQNSYSTWTFNAANDQICMACHLRLGKAWYQSAHANAASQEYLAGAAAARDFPAGTKVFQAGCLNCHDTHTVSGSRTLLREGVNSPYLTLNTADIGYDAQIRAGVALPAGTHPNTASAIENTCFQCHSDGVAGRPAPIINGTALDPTKGVPNIAAEYARAIRMPITSKDQGDFLIGNTFERHEVIDNNGIELATNLGAGVRANRHAECTDCHNPHRVVKNSRFDLKGVSTQRTHQAGGTTANKGADGNIASGALRGVWGVEPTYTGVATSAWPRVPTGYTIKKGDPTSEFIGVGDTSKASSFLTREYQLCFKCHSDYANGPLPTDFPRLKPIGNTRGGTPVGTNGVMRYTNVAAEFGVNATDPPTSNNDQGEIDGDPLYTPSPSPPGDCYGTACGSGSTATANQPKGDGYAGNQNHRSWHPVLWPTGRTVAERMNNESTTFDNIRAPFNNPANIGYQTMQCSDCHGSEESWTQGGTGSTSNGPNLSKVQGPHGSNNPFLLKGIWNDSSTTGITTRDTNTSGSICGRCHNPGIGNSGFPFHMAYGKDAVSCSLCHIAMPHGWKNKAFLNNLSCIGSEIAGYPAGCTEIPSSSVRITMSPYYMRAGLHVTIWTKSRAWALTSCNGNGDGPGSMPAPCGDGT